MLVALFGSSKPRGRQDEVLTMFNATERGKLGLGWMEFGLVDGPAPAGSGKPAVAWPAKDPERLSSSLTSRD